MSLWDMLEKYAYLFAEAFSSMVDAKGLCGFSAHAAEMPPEGLPDHGLRLMVLSGAQKLRAACIYADMDGALPSLDRLEKKVSPAVSGIPGMPIGAVAHEVETVLARLRDDLQNEYVFHVDQRDVPLYVAFGFGSKVGKKFPLACEDIEEASKCLALQRPTACVFHLMRAMEVTVQRLAKKLGIKKLDRVWGNLLSDMAEAIKLLPKGSPAHNKKRDAWSLAHTHLYHVKQAWRNDTMHPKQTYTREQAHEVFQAVRVFMIHLADLA